MIQKRDRPVSYTHLDVYKRQVQCWYVGFWPKENPHYVITVFEEDGEGGGATCGPVFKEIAEELYALSHGA